MEALRLLLFAMVSATIVSAQTTPRPEFRVVNHWQRFTTDKNYGVAAYINEPDIIHGGPKIYGTIGLGLRDKGKTRWLEIMGGGLTSRTGFDPALDVRGQFKIHWLDNLTPWGEYLHFFKSGRTLLSSSLTKTFRKRYKLGIESDTWKQKVGGGTGVGPGAGIILTQHLQAWSAYQFGVGEQHNVWRTYFVVNW